jgi:hypothetical protein
MRLINVEKRAKDNPKTFEIPDLLERQNLKMGHFAKLIFNDKERMWVKVTEVLEGSYVGTLANEPVVVKMKFGDRVEFEPKHIADIYVK